MGSMSASAEDVERWRREDRFEILDWCDVNFLGSADLWINQFTGKEAERCPFVRKVRNQPRYICTIYETRPAVCREYPIHVSHMESIGCEMLEPGDTDADVARFMENAERTEIVNTAVNTTSRKKAK